MKVIKGDEAERRTGMKSIKEKTYLAVIRGSMFGIKGNIGEAMSHPNCPEVPQSLFLRCTPGHYDDTVIDFRFEDGEWQQ